MVMRRRRRSWQCDSRFLENNGQSAIAVIVGDGVSALSND